MHQLKNMKIDFLDQLFQELLQPETWSLFWDTLYNAKKAIYKNNT